MFDTAQIARTSQITIVGIVSILFLWPRFSLIAFIDLGLQVYIMIWWRCLPIKRMPSGHHFLHLKSWWSNAILSDGFLRGLKLLIVNSLLWMFKTYQFCKATKGLRHVTLFARNSPELVLRHVTTGFHQREVRPNVGLISSCNKNANHIEANEIMNQDICWDLSMGTVYQYMEVS